MRGDISPLTPERDDRHAEHYSSSAFEDTFPATTEMPCRVPTGFMPPPPVDHSISMQKHRSNTPQMQGNLFEFVIRRVGAFVFIKFYLIFLLMYSHL